MPANVDAMVRAGVEAFRAGNKAEARTLLEKALEADEYNEQAWLWLSAVVDTPEEQRTCLENVLVINPKNDRARMGLKSLGVDPDAIAAPPPPGTPSPFTDTSFVADDVPSSSPFAADVDDWDEEEPPTASSSASSTSFRGDQHSSSDYDNWIDSMGIGGSKKGGVAGPFETPDLEIEDSGLFGEDEESQSVVPVTPTRSSPGASSSMFDDEDDLRMVMDDDDLEVEDEDFLSSEVMAEFDAALDDDNEATLDDLFNDGDLAEMPDMRTTGEYMSAAANEPDPQVMFAMIPAEIRPASRLPGENEASPRGLVAGVIVLAVLNLAALGFLVMQMM